MSDLSAQLIQEAKFNPKIKAYLFAMGALSFLVTIIGIPFLLVYPLGIGQYFSRRYYESLSCRLTKRHLEFKKGAFFKVEKTIPLENIQDLNFIDNPFLNYFVLQMLKIETAGQSNPQGSDM
ncbi:MAG: PH domain-containing protein, partial [Bacteroidota bacterium]